MGTFLIIACYGPIVYCHISIFRSVRQHNKHNIQMANSRSEQNKRVNMQVDEMKVTKLLFAIVLAFTCCWSPLIVIDGVSMFTGKYWMPREVYMTYTYLVGYSSSVNPVIYRIFNPQLRQELCQLPSFRRTRRVGAQWETRELTDKRFLTITLINNSNWHWHYTKQPCQYLTHTRPHHPGNGSHGQLFRLSQGSSA